MSNGVGVTGAWGDSLTGRYYFVGGNTTGQGYNVFMMTSASTVATVQFNTPNHPTAIHGRAISGTERDIYAVGQLGNEVLHSTGDGTWTPVQIPTTNAMNGVYVAPNGDVVAVGFGGQIAHYH